MRELQPNLNDVDKDVREPLKVDITTISPETA
jgi:hypothetical protein